jgi:hypothetical protein
MSRSRMASASVGSHEQELPLAAPVDDGNASVALDADGVVAEISLMPSSALDMKNSYPYIDKIDR